MQRFGSGMKVRDSLCDLSNVAVLSILSVAVLPYTDVPGGRKSKEPGSALPNYSSRMSVAYAVNLIMMIWHANTGELSCRASKMCCRHMCFTITEE